MSAKYYLLEVEGPDQQIRYCWTVIYPTIMFQINCLSAEIRLLEVNKLAVRSIKTIYHPSDVPTEYTEILCMIIEHYNAKASRAGL